MLKSARRGVLDANGSTEASTLSSAEALSLDDGRGGRGHAGRLSLRAICPGAATFGTGTRGGDAADSGSLLAERGPDHLRTRGPAGDAEGADGIVVS